MNFIRSKTFFISLLGLLIVGAVLFITFTGDRVQYGEADSSLEVIKRAQQFAAGEASRVDTDKDGLYDWEETLWGSDPKKSDTDGDGAKDGEEVDADRNPTIPGPKDSLVDSTTGEIVFPGEENSEDLTSTDKISREFFGTYLKLRQEGTLEDSVVQEDLFKTILKNIPTASSFKSLNGKDILVGPREGKEAAKDYGNALAALMLQPQPAQGNEAEILLKALAEEDEDEILKLEAIAESYSDFFSGLKTLVVPKDAELLHLNLVNAAGALEQNVRDMQQAFIDPVVMFGATVRYEKEAINLYNATLEIQLYLERSGVAFGAEEPGAILMTLTPRQ